MKKTFDLYRCSPLSWANMGFEEALHFRIDKASEAMTYYRTEANKLIKFSNEYRAIVKKYTDSEDAVDWNRKFLEEIKEERRRLNAIDNSKNKARSLHGERIQGSSIRCEECTEPIPNGTWQWLKNSLRLVKFVTKT